MQFAGQAKCYLKTKKVKTDDIERTRLCVYRARACTKEDIFHRIEIATPSGVVLGKCKIKMDDVDHQIITDLVINKWYKMCLKMSLEEKHDLQQEDEQYLRECQVNALENIIPGRINRIKMACGSGKTRVVAEVIARKSGVYLVLVPYITLLEQWGAYLDQFQYTVHMVGTGYPFIGYIKRKINETVVVVCVYDSYEKVIYMQKEGKRYFRAFEYVFIDEAHHIDHRENNRSGEIWKYINREGKSSVMLSASLEDDLYEESFQVHYNYTLRNAIDDGICCDYDIRMEFFDILPTMDVIAERISINTEYLSVLAYCNSIASAKRLASECNKLGVTAISLSCEESKAVRTKIIQEFKNGKYRVLVSVNTLGEGINLRCADTILFAEPRSSAISIIQCIGRVVRIYEGKQMAHIVVCTNQDRAESIASHPTVKIIRALANDDPYFVKKVTTGRSSRIRYECVQGKDEDLKTYEERAEWLWTDVYDKSMQCVLWRDWDIKCEMLKEYYEKHKKYPLQRDGTLGIWYCTQKNAARKNILSQERRKILDTLPCWLPEVKENTNIWNRKFDLLKAYYEEYKKYPPQRKGILGKWYNSQKVAARRNILSQERRKLLDELPEWLPEVKQINTWNKNFELLETYYEEHKKYPLTKEGILGCWYDSQKVAARKNILSQERREMLNTLPGWLPPDIKNIWYEKFVLLETYYKKNKKYPAQCEGPLAYWYHRQKAAARNNKLSQERIQILNTLPGWLTTK